MFTLDIAAPPVSYSFEQFQPEVMTEAKAKSVTVSSVMPGSEAFTEYDCMAYPIEAVLGGEPRQ